MKQSIVLLILLVLFVFRANAQCTNFIQENFDSFEYTTTCPYIIPGTTYQSSPQVSPGFGPSYTGNYHLYLNFVDGFTGPAVNRPYTVCVGATYRLSFYHKDAWGGTNNTTFNIYDGNNTIVYSQTVNWSGSNWNHWVSPELTATTTTLRLEIVNNLAYQGNNDMVVDDMLLEICANSESVSLSGCDITGTTNLFDLFSTSMPINGTWNGPATLANGYLGTYNPTLPSGTYTYTVGTCGAYQGTVVVQDITPVDLGPDIQLCTQQSVTLNAGNNHDTYLWSNGATTSSIAVNASGTYSVIAKKMGNNLVQHGDFQGGTTNTTNSFTTNYIPGTGGAWGLLSNSGEYAISTSPQLTHNNFSNCGDHTTGTGNMFIANGASAPNTVVWSQTININQNQDYLFSFWAMNVVNDPNVSNLQLYINGNPIGAINQTSLTPCIWTQINDTWNSGAATQAVLSIVNQSSASGGNDFAIDDIVFTTYCSYYDTVQVTISNNNLQVSPNQTICQGDMATLTATATSTIPGTTFTYNWINQSNNTNTLQVSPTTSTSYSVVATDQNGCNTATKTVSVIVSPNLNPNAGQDFLVCLGDTIPLSGTINHATNTKNWTYLAPATTPTPSVNFLPNASSLNTSVVVDQPGVYSFILTEGNQACGTLSDTVLVTVSQSTQTVTTTDLTCFGNQSGSIQVISVDAVNYSYDNGQTWETSNTKTGLSAGTYTVLSENQFGCKSDTTVIISQPAPIQLQVSNDTLICENGTATLTASIGQANATYHWNHTTDLSGTQSVQPTSTTTYTVKGESSAGCLTDGESIVVSIRNPLTATISPDVAICPGETANLTVSNISGGLAPYTTLWSVNQNTNTITVSPQQTTQYTVTISDNCESTPISLVTTVTVRPIPTPIIQSTTTALCEPAQFEITCSTDPSLIQSVSWFISDGQSFINQSTINTLPMPTGNYTVDVIITSPDGCVGSATFSNYLTVYPLPKAAFNWNPNPVKIFDTNVTFINYSSNAQTYEWSFANGSPSYSTNENPSVKFPEGTDGKYAVSLIVTSQYGCKDTVNRDVVVLPEVLLFAPNTFTPDGNEFNQDWRIYISGIDEYNFELTIYNRWGEMVWQSKDVNMGWDGTYKGEKVQDGTYSWQIYAKERNNDNHYHWTGTVNVIK
ncbi:MAG: gliding motility-associated C-terminal domain-containing protein [Crocinitomicaceae bacterium]|nr:gliding motility-associated C-terminal domain-containing protein [Crocinitomicaceae bacterium]